MPFNSFNSYSLMKGGSESTKLIFWLIMVLILVGITVTGVILVHTKLISKYNELTEGTKDDNNN